MIDIYIYITINYKNTHKKAYLKNFANLGIYSAKF